MTNGIFPREPSEAETEALVMRLHAGQTDAGGQPYHLHLFAVRDLLGPYAPLEERLVALLHDTIEDIPDFGATDLIGLGFRAEIVASVMCLTRPPSAAIPRGAIGPDGWDDRERAYLDKIQAIIASGDVRAMRVKRADNRHNADPARDVHLNPRQRAWAERRRQLYTASIGILEAGLDALGVPYEEPAPSLRY